MNKKEATEILHSLTTEKRQEALNLYNFLAGNMRGGNWDTLKPQQKILIMYAFAIEYGRRTAGKNDHEPAADTSGTGTPGTAAETN